MTTAPVPLTDELLGTRQAKTIVMLSTEEVLPMQIPAYVANKSEISFLVRQPSASAILVNAPYIELQLKFTIQRTTGAALTSAPLYSAKESASKSYGRKLEGLPFLSKCVRTSVITINGATNTYRNSEYFVPYLRATVSRDAMAKIGTPWNDNEEQYQRSANGYATREANGVRVLGKTASKQARLFDMSMTKEGGADRTNAETLTVTYQEPLFMSVFNGLQGNELWPTWCSEQNKSPSILHAQQTSINFNLHDNWEQNLFGLIQHRANDGQAAKITGVEIVRANLCCKFVQPPPKFIAAALSANVTYQSNKFMRFRAKYSGAISRPLGQADSFPNYVWPMETVDFDLEAVNFPYMPSVFMIEVGPDYNEKANFIASHNVSTEQQFAEMSKEDRRFGICGVDLIVNTSPDVVPDRGKGDSDSNITTLRYNTRELYNLYLKNSASVERAIYDYDTWFQRGCCVLLTSADMNGILPSCHIRGNVSVQGTIRAVNTLGYKVYVGPGSGGTAVARDRTALSVQDNGQAGPVSWIVGQKYEKFECAITGVYSNQYMALDAKSGIVGESVMSEQFGNSMRLSSMQ